MIAWFNRQLDKLFGKSHEVRCQDEDLRGHFNQQMQRAESAMRLGQRIAAHTHHETDRARQSVCEIEQAVNTSMETVEQRQRRIAELFNSAARGKRHNRSR